MKNKILEFNKTLLTFLGYDLMFRQASKEWFYEVYTNDKFKTIFVSKTEYCLPKLSDGEIAALKKVIDE